MVEIEFNYNQMITVIQADFADTFKYVINKYAQKTLIDPKTTYFLSNGKVINLEKTVESHMNKLNRKL